MAGCCPGGSPAADRSSPGARSAQPRTRSSTGITRSLHSMVLSAIDLDDHHGGRRRQATQIGKQGERSSPAAWAAYEHQGVAVTRRRRRARTPPIAIGRTNRLITSRYSGSNQLAGLEMASSTFSITATWN